MTATPLPEPASRWTAQQRADRLARVRTVRWLWENALVDQLTLQAAMGGRYNACQDIQAAGGQARWWLQSHDIAAQRRHLEGGFYRPSRARPPRVPPVQTVSPPPANLRQVGEWLTANSAESAKSVGEFFGSKFHAPPMAARGRGAGKWSMGDLDRIHPDATIVARHSISP